MSRAKLIERKQHTGTTWPGLICSRRAAEQKNAAAATRPAGTRAAGVGGSSGTMLKLYTDDVGQGFKVYASSFFYSILLNVGICSN